MVKKEKKSILFSEVGILWRPPFYADITSKTADITSCEKVMDPRQPIRFSYFFRVSNDTFKDANITFCEPVLRINEPATANQILSFQSSV